MKWESVQRLHAETAAELASVAERVPAEKWLIPRADGKWSPAEVMEHLNLAYDVLQRELAGGAGMQIRTKLWQRIVLRVTMVPKLLRGGAFPAGSRAPREIRPATAPPDQGAAITAFRDRAARFEAAAAEAQRSQRRVRLTHAYFGSSSIPDAVLLCTRHIQHHQKQLTE
jgi:hypothetical protein